MAETLLEFQGPVIGPDGTIYQARACGVEMPGGTWEGWIEFVSLGERTVLRTARETTQPNRADAQYWATGLSPVYLEGALQRALHPRVSAPEQKPAPPAFPAPEPLMSAPDQSRAARPSVLNPFSVYEQGETSLRRRLQALSAWHLVNILVDHGLSREDPAVLERLPDDELIDRIVNAVRAEADRLDPRRL
jgi:hypothetical protein